MTKNDISMILYNRLTTLAYVSSLPYLRPGPPSWSPYIQSIQKKWSNISHAINFVFWTSQILSFYTQKHLNSQQKSDQLLYALVHPFLYVSSITIVYLKDDVRKLIHNVVKNSSDFYKDKTVERQMVKKCNTAVGLVLGMAAVSFTTTGIEHSIKALIKGAVFTPIITAWPKVEDRSYSASVGRVCVYIAWFNVFLPVCGAVPMIISLTITTSHQYIQLQSYFNNLSSIFKEVSEQKEKEIKYEEGLKLGIKQHVKLLGYTMDLIKICNPACGAQTMLNIFVAVTNMLVLVDDDRTIAKMLINISVIITSTLVLGFYLCSIGDIAIEASNLTSAMYGSGWENCGRGSSVRVRKLLGVAMAQTQKPLLIITLGIVPVSYASFLSIAKTTYSVFSVLY
nr:odorant receptor 24 [Achelura yunnanensis]